MKQLIVKANLSSANNMLDKSIYYVLIMYYIKNILSVNNMLYN